MEITQGVARSAAAQRKNTAIVVDTEVDVEEEEEEEEGLGVLNTNIRCVCGSGCARESPPRKDPDMPKCER